MTDIDSLLKSIKHIHFIGIGGSGMCPLAEILLSCGYEISGSDNNEGDNLEKLKKLGAVVVMGQKPENIEGAEMIVYTAALLADNPELTAAKNSGIPVFERSKLFGAVTRMFNDCIAVCGTHGKTTATSLISQILVENEIDPTLVIGGKLPLIDSHGRVGKSDTMVCEACEFVDTFLDLSPNTAVLLNIDGDHLDYFKSVENLISSFAKFASMATDTVIYNGDDKRTLDALSLICDKIEPESNEYKDELIKAYESRFDEKPARSNAEMISFGFNSSNNFYPENITFNNGSYPEFDIIHNGEKAGHIVLSIPGNHNILNALAAVAVSLKAGIDFDKISESAEHFKGAGRRFEILGSKNGITVADDYAHHPTEIRATLEAAMRMDYNEVWAVFQPFTFSRTSMLFNDFVDVLSIPDHTILTEIMGSRERNTYGIHSAQLVEKIPGAVGPMSFEEISDYVMSHAKTGDLVITLGCGDVYKCARMMLKGADDNKLLGEEFNA